MAIYSTNKMRRMQVLWQGWARVIRAGAAAVAERGLQHSWWLCLYGAPFPGARACVWAPAAQKAFSISGSHLQPCSEAAVGGERCLIQVLLPSLLQPARKRLVPMGCSTPAPGASTPGGFLIKKKTGNLHKVGDAMLVRLLRAPQGSATSTC